MAPKSERLRTFEDVFHRIRWDDACSAEDLIIGYEDRLVGRMEMPLADFVPISEGGDLPMHRIWYLRRGDSVLWDRRRRLDLFFGSGMTSTILASGEPSIDEITAAQIREGKANVAQAEQVRQHMKDVRDHAAARHLYIAQASDGWSSMGGASAPIRDATSLCSGIVGRNRAQLIVDVFNLLDLDDDGKLNSPELKRFAVLTGFDGDDDEWASEYQFLCPCDGGMDASSFLSLVNDESDEGCYCNIDELAILLKNLGKTTATKPIDVCMDGGLLHSASNLPAEFALEEGCLMDRVAGHLPVKSEAAEGGSKALDNEGL